MALQILLFFLNKKKKVLSAKWLGCNFCPIRTGLNFLFKILDLPLPPSSPSPSNDQIVRFLHSLCTSVPTPPPSLIFVAGVEGWERMYTGYILHYCALTCHLGWCEYGTCHLLLASTCITKPLEFVNIRFSSFNSKFCNTDAKVT